MSKRKSPSADAFAGACVATTRRRAALLLHFPPSVPEKSSLLADAAIKDLRTHRVFSPSAPVVLDCSPDRMDKRRSTSSAAAESGDSAGQIESTPLESVPAAVEFKAAKEERKGIGPYARSRLVRCPSSFGYKRMLPFLMEIAKDESGPPVNRSLKVETFNQTIPEMTAAATEDSIDDHLLSPEQKQLSSDTGVQLAVNSDPALPKVEHSRSMNVISGPKVENPDAVFMTPIKISESIPGKAFSDGSASMQENLNSEISFVSKSSKYLEVSVGETETTASVADMAHAQLSTSCHSVGILSLETAESVHLLDPNLIASSGVSKVQKTCPTSSENSPGLSSSMMSASGNTSIALSYGFHIPEVTSDQPIKSSDLHVEPVIKPLDLRMSPEQPDMPVLLDAPSNISSCVDMEHSFEVNSRGNLFGNPPLEGICSDGSSAMHSSMSSDMLDFELLHRAPDCSQTPAMFLSPEEMSGCLRGLTYSPEKSSMPAKNDIKPVTIPLQRQAISPYKGVLKMQEKGCKDICPCLECATFRLRAERTFEFSRNQMKEADDIIGGLIKEMSALRSLVEKSLFPQLNQQQIREACLRASWAEEEASHRCKQMLAELNMHCRTPGRRVTFAQSIEGRKSLLPQE